MVRGVLVMNSPASSRRAIGAVLLAAGSGSRMGHKPKSLLELGGVPLIFAFGAGAEAREVLGWIIVGGLGLATLATLYLTPVAYLLLAGLSKPKAAEAARLRRELAEAAARQAQPAE
jgi:hypothetical protein